MNETITTPAPATIEIRNRYTGKVLRTVPGESLRSANLAGADLWQADLRGADLSGADLSRANLRGADLTGANLSGASLSEANLRLAALADADLRDAYLYQADLSGADLTRAVLGRAVLGQARLYNVLLYGADLTSAGVEGTDLRSARGVLYAELYGYTTLAWRREGELWLRYGCENRTLAYWKENLARLCGLHVWEKSAEYQAVIGAWIGVVEAWAAAEFAAEGASDEA